MKSAGKNETLTNRKAVMLMMTAMVAVMRSGSAPKNLSVRQW